jgi:hypothetical protein
MSDTRAAYSACRGEIPGRGIWRGRPFTTVSAWHGGEPL